MVADLFIFWIILNKQLIQVSTSASGAKGPVLVFVSLVKFLSEIPHKHHVFLNTFPDSKATEAHVRSLFFTRFAEQCDS